jgi:hypothetical protein
MTDSEKYTSKCVVVVQIEDGGMDVPTKLGQQPCLVVPASRQELQIHLGLQGLNATSSFGPYGQKYLILKHNHIKYLESQIYMKTLIFGLAAPIQNL